MVLSVAESSNSELKKSKQRGRIAVLTITIAATVCISCKEARYARNAVLGPYTTENGPCPTENRHSDAIRTKIRSSTHRALRGDMSKSIYADYSSVNKYLWTRVFGTDSERLRDAHDVHGEA